MAVGEEGGNGVANVLLGDHAPSGRLPVSLPQSVGQLPVHYNRRPNDSRFDYVYEPAEPLYPFGHGESYKTFEYGDLALAADEIATDGSIQASVTSASARCSAMSPWMMEYSMGQDSPASH